MTSYYQGAPVRLSVTVRDFTGTLVTPTTIVLTVTKPDATVGTYSSPTADSLGQYHQDVPALDLTQVGHHQYVWTTTGPGAGVVPGSFDLRDPLAVQVLTLNDAKDHVDIPQATTTHDVELQSWLDTIQTSLEKMTGGPIFNRAVTERVEVGSGYKTLALRQRPVVSVTSITDVASGTVLPVTDLDVDSNSGIVRRKLNLPFWSRGPFYTVTYVAGWGTSVPAPFNSAARIIVGHLWATQHGPSQRPTLGGDETVTPPGFGFAIPNRAAELLSPYLVEMAI